MKDRTEKTIEVALLDKDGYSLGGGEFDSISRAKKYAKWLLAVGILIVLREGGESAVIVRAHRDTTLCKAGGQKARR